jgi:ribonuclease G
MKSELFVSRFAGRTWSVLREAGEVVELRVDDGQPEGLVGRLVKARVTKVLPGIQSAFLDIGLERDAFLHVADLLLPGEKGSVDPPGHEDLADLKEVRTVLRRRDSGKAPIQDRLKVGRELLVQIQRDAMGSKGARVSCHITLPGRYLVHLPQAGIRAVSRRIREVQERDRLGGIVKSLPPPGGFIVRTAGAGAGEEAFEADAAWLAGTWKKVLEETDRATAPSTIHDELDLLLRLLRSAPRNGFETIWVDRETDYSRAVEYLRHLDPAMASRVRLHSGEHSLFDTHGLDEEIDRAMRPRVWLKSGGYLVIEPTEALVSIDVNTGKYVGKSKPEDTILKTNLEAAAVIGRQLRLRDLGGIVVIDFIDMELPDNRLKVTEALVTALKSDPARTKVGGLGEFGLLQLTRKKTRSGFARLLTRSCPRCAGLGRVRRAETVAAEAMEEIRRISGGFAPGRFLVRAHPDVAESILLELQSVSGPVDDLLPDRIEVREDESLNPEVYELVAF